MDFPPTFNVFFKLSSLNVPKNPFVKIIFSLVSWEFFTDLSVLISFSSRIVLSLLTLFFRVFVWKVFLSSVTFTHFLISILWLSDHFRRSFSKLCWLFFVKPCFHFYRNFFLIFTIFSHFAFFWSLKLFPKISIIVIRFLLNFLMIIFNVNSFFSISRFLHFWSFF